MNHNSLRRLFIILVLTTLSLGLALAAGAQEVWEGFDYYFEKPNYADWNLPENQDRITPSVWLTRANMGSVYNIAQEDSYVTGSPMDTEWATGQASDWQNLTFTNFFDWAGSHNPSNMIGVDAVVHLISDDIYIAIRWNSFISGNQGAGISYYRSNNPPIPVEPSSLGMIKLLY